MQRKQYLQFLQPNHPSHQLSSHNFLVFNKYPASIFMGDTGSFVLGTGYAAAVLISDIPYFGVLALGVPIASVVVSLLHTLNHYGMSERKIVLSYWGVTVLLCVIGILAQLYIF